MEYKKAFTIVELLIVIVVIGILAAITIISYTGIQNKAVVASLQSDLNNASQQLKMFQVDNSAYPTVNSCPAPTIGKICLKASNGTAYHYSVDNSSNPQTFCLTATKGTQSYKITNDSTPSSGVCTITNLITNPSFESNVTGWYAYTGLSAPTQVTSNPWSGSARLAAVGNNTYVTPRVRYSLPVVAGDTITVSAHIRSDGQTPTSLFFVIKTTLGGSEVTSPVVESPAWAPDADGWMRISATYTVPANIDGLLIQPGVRVDTNYIGTLGVDAVIAIKGSPAVDYADGSSATWVWNGTANNSTSTGPILGL